jgi:hypothetical protein
LQYLKTDIVDIADIEERILTLHGIRIVGLQLHRQDLPDRYTGYQLAGLLAECLANMAERFASPLQRSLGGGQS